MVREALIKQYVHNYTINNLRHGDGTSVKLGCSQRVMRRQLGRSLALLAVLFCGWNLLLPTLPPSLAQPLAPPTAEHTRCGSSESRRSELAILAPPSLTLAALGLCEQLARAGARSVVVTHSEPTASELADFTIALASHSLPPGRLRTRYAATRSAQLASALCDERCTEHALASEIALVASSPRDAQHMRFKHGIPAVRTLPASLPEQSLHWNPPWWLPLSFLWNSPMVDCSLIGGTPSWRAKIATMLEERDITVDTTASTFEPGPLRDTAVSRGTLVLNLHEESEASLEMQRLCELLAMGHAVFSERSADSVLDAHLEAAGAVRFPTTPGSKNESIADAVFALLSDPSALSQLRSNGIAFASRLARSTSDAARRLVKLKRSGPSVMKAPLAPSRDRARRPLSSLPHKTFRAGASYQSYASEKRNEGHMRSNVH